MVPWQLLANSGEVSEAFRRYSRRSHSLRDNWLLIAIVIGIPLFWWGIHLWDKRRKKISLGGADSKSLFAELCQAHGLNWSERSLITRAAQAKRIEHPAAVFIDPSILGSFASSQSPEAAEYGNLAGKLFGDLLAE